MNYFNPEAQEIQPGKNFNWKLTGADGNIVVTAIARPLLSYRWANEKLYAIKYCIVMSWTLLPVGSEARILWSEVRSTNQLATQTL